MKKNVKKYVIGAVAIAGVTGFTGGIYASYSKELTKEISAAESITTVTSSSNYDSTNATGVITLNGTTATGKGTGYTIEDGVVTITSAGTFVLRGEGELQVLVDAKDQDVELVLDGVTLSNEADAPIFVKKAGTMKIYLPDGSVNTISDMASAVELTEENEREGNAVIFSKEDLTIDGTGTLKVNGNYKNGITSKDNLFINNGNFVVTAVNNGIVGKDSLTILDGTFTIDVENDGLQSDSTEAELGYVKILDGDFNITSAHDGIQAESLLQIDNGNFNIITNEGSANAPAQTGNEFGGGMGGQGRPDFGTMDITSMPDFNITTMRETLETLDSATLESLGLASLDSLSDEELLVVLQGLDETQVRTIMHATFGGGMGKGGMTPPEMPSGDTQTSATVEGGAMPEGGMTPPDMQNGMTPPTKPSGEQGTMEPPTVPSTEASATVTTTESADTTTTEDTTVSDSYKTLKGNEIIINNGTFNLDSYDDAINSDTVLTINGGTFTIATGDDAIHSESLLTINNGTIDIISCYEGLEAENITINDGKINIVSTDDAINASSSDSTTEVTTIDESTTPYILINGGYISVNSSGDGIDSNGALDINGGEVYVDGPINGPDLAVDFDNGNANVNGGRLIAVGSSSMVHSFKDTSTQSSFIYFFTANQPAGSTIKLTDKNGKVVLEYTAEKEYSSLIISDSTLVAGETYTLTNGTTTEDITLSATTSSTTFGTSIEQGGMGMQGGRGFNADTTTSATTK